MNDRAETFEPLCPVCMPASVAHAMRGRLGRLLEDAMEQLSVELTLHLDLASRGRINGPVMTDGWLRRQRALVTDAMSVALTRLAFLDATDPSPITLPDRFGELDPKAQYREVAKYVVLLQRRRQGLYAAGDPQSAVAASSL